MALVFMYTIMYYKLVLEILTILLLGIDLKSIKVQEQIYKPSILTMIRTMASLE